MLGTQHLLLFVVSGLLLNIAPGPDSLLVVTRSASQGWRAGSAAALGIGAGTCVHVAAAALGLSAVLATSAAAFTVVKYAGAAYLLYVGLTLLRQRGQAPAADASTLAAVPPLPWRRIFLQGFLTNVLNPKMAVFFLAFVPQFIAPDAPSKPLAFLLLGGIFNLNGMLWCHLLAVGTAFASRRVRISAAARRWIHRLVGAVFVSLGVKLALSARA
ncbi:LysE family translocator [Eleftheria terrae]|uniref:LysE family translocator n=1 Tax=Eleftheria terrae TaxID=1597781 RepID=UPI00263BD84E|nr:LysE family translocator [Eleftheria terrae]WKB52518.1 LysE family translocator [Eleftheria terrae]